MIPDRFGNYLRIDLKQLILGSSRQVCPQSILVKKWFARLRVLTMGAVLWWAYWARWARRAWWARWIAGTGLLLKAWARGCSWLIQHSAKGPNWLLVL